MTAATRLAKSRRDRHWAFLSRLSRCVAFGLLSTVLAAMPVAADSFDEGVTAHQEGQPEAALRNWTDAAEQGHFLAQYNLGIMYLKGMGVARSYSAAIRWFSRASRAGFGPAAVNLGLLFEKGLGVPMDAAIALAHLDAGVKALSDGPCRELARQWRARIAADLNMAARAQAEKEAKTILGRLWTQSFLVPAEKCFESVAYSGGKVQGLTAETRPPEKPKSGAKQRERGEQTETPQDGRPARTLDTSPADTDDAVAYFVQMISLTREAAARRELARLRKRHAKLLGRTDLDLQKAKRATLGNVYRVRAGPFGEKQAARHLCDGLRERGQDCFVVQSRVPEPRRGLH